MKTVPQTSYQTLTAYAKSCSQKTHELYLPLTPITQNGLSKAYQFNKHTTKLPSHMCTFPKVSWISHSCAPLDCIPIWVIAINLMILQLKRAELHAWKIFRKVCRTMQHKRMFLFPILIHLDISQLTCPMWGNGQEFVTSPSAFPPPSSFFRVKLCAVIMNVHPIVIPSALLHPIHF